MDVRCNVKSGEAPMVNRTDGAECDFCCGFLPLNLLSKCPVTGAIICLACQSKPSAEDVA